jgi:serine/threonine protein kinase
MTSSSSLSFGPTEIGSNELIRERRLGVGVYGEVYLCRCRSFYVAVKTIRPSARPNINAFMSEMKIMAKLFHPNICLYMGACSEPNQLMIVCEVSGSFAATEFFRFLL